jgi:hypothetical protein
MSFTEVRVSSKETCRPAPLDRMEPPYGVEVRVGSKYTYRPVRLDRMEPPYGVVNGFLKEGDYVQVYNLHGGPPANEKGHCYVRLVESGEFAGLVCIDSLVRE